MTAVADIRSTTPLHLWLVGAVAILWNAYGAYDYWMSQTARDAYFRTVGMSGPQIAYFHAMPAWMTGVWAVGVWGGVLGAVLLLLRSRHAAPVFGLSLAAFLVSVLYAFGVSGAGEVMTPRTMIMDAVIAAACLVFAAYAWRMRRVGVLH
jgi:hypothetical protein